MDAPMNDEPTQTRSEKKALEEARMHSWLNGGAYHSEDVDELALLKLEAKQLQRVQASLLRERERLLARATRSTQPPPEAKHVVGKQLYEPLSCENLLDIDMPLVDNVDHESLLHTQYVVENYGESIHDSVVPSLSMDAPPLVISPLPAMPLIVIVDACKNVWCSFIAGELQLVASPFLASPSPITRPQATPLPAKPLPIHVPNPRPSLLRIDEGLFGRGQHHGITRSGYYDHKGTVYPASHNCFHDPTALSVTIAHGTPPVRVAQHLIELAPGYSTLNRAALGMEPQDKWQWTLMAKHGPDSWLNMAVKVDHTPATQISFVNMVLRPLLEKFIVEYIKGLGNAQLVGMNEDLFERDRHLEITCDVVTKIAYHLPLGKPGHLDSEGNYGCNEMVYPASHTCLLDPTALSNTITHGTPLGLNYAYSVDVAYLPSDPFTGIVHPFGNILIPEVVVPNPLFYNVFKDSREALWDPAKPMIDNGPGSASLGSYALQFSARPWELSIGSSQMHNSGSLIGNMTIGKSSWWKATLSPAKIASYFPIHQLGIHHTLFVSNLILLVGTALLGYLVFLPSVDEHLQERGIDGGPSSRFYSLDPILAVLLDPEPVLEKPSGLASKQIQMELAWALWKGKSIRKMLVKALVENQIAGSKEFLKTTGPGQGIPGSVPVHLVETGQGLNGPQIGFVRKQWKDYKYEQLPAQVLAPDQPLSYLAGHLQPD